MLASLQARNEELSFALARARNAERERIAFMAMVSHELRTPLNAVTGFSEAALHGVRGPLPAPYRDYFETVYGAGRHLEALVDDLLDLSHLETGRFTLRTGPISARLLIADSRSMVVQIAERHGVDIGRVGLDDEWVLHVDAMRARQILMNLLVNAIKFTPEGGAVGIEATPAAKGLLDIAVWDTGIGIAATEHERIFEAFHQVAGQAVHGEGKGTGLGLAIARQLARAMGGDIRLSSTLGKGSRFIAQLPLAPDARPPIAA